MALELVAKLVKKLPVQSGTSARGSWSKQEFVVETQENYPRTICMNVWGADKVEELSRYREGELYKFHINLESREFNQRWYTDVRAWRIEPVETQAAGSAPSYAPPTPMISENDLLIPEGEDDLPF